MDLIYQPFYLMISIYQFIREGVVMNDGFPQLDASQLIPLKIKAFLNLLAQKNKGEKVKSIDLEKHFRDVFRLYALLAPNMRIKLPNDIGIEMKMFLANIRAFPKALSEFQNPLSGEEILAQIEQIFTLRD